MCNDASFNFTATEDYTEPSPFTVVFLSGTSSGSSITTRMNTTDDSAAEGTHSFTVTINTTNSSVTVGSPVTAKILDNDSKSGWVIV